MVKYQVFVSSTYEDLIEERKEATQALLECGCIPTGMELFPASNKKQWEIIKRVIDDCDYYLLIIGGRYGSLGVDDTGKKVGYTEMEFDYALSTGKPIIAFIHSMPEKLPYEKNEKTKLGIQRLNKFRNKVKTNRMIQYWTNKDNLKAAIHNSIPSLIKDNPSGGWTKQNGLILETSSTRSSNDIISGKWKSVTEQLFVDYLFISYPNDSPYFMGKIVRQEPASQKGRNWNCVGCLVGESMIIMYESQVGYSAGCALVRHYRDSSYKGSYLRFNYKTKVIDRKDLTIEKVIEDDEQSQ